MAAMTAADMMVHVGADVNDAIGGLGRVDSAVNKGGASFGKASLLMGAGAGIIAGGFGMAINGAMNFEGAMADVSASLGTTAAEYKDLSNLALQIGQDTAFSATEGAMAIEELGKAGVAVTDIMAGAGMAAANLASATGTQIPEAANVMANAMNAFQLSGDQAAATADTITAAVNESSASMPDFAMGMASAGAMANAAGMSLEQTAGAIALFTNYGLSGADAGTALRAMLSSMAAPSAEARAEFDKWGISLQEGIDSGDLMGYTAEKLKTNLAGLSESERMAALNTMFGADAQRIANILYSEGAEGVGTMTDKMESNGQAAEASARRMAGLRGAMESLSGSVETAFIMFGSLFTPILNVAARGVTKLVNGLAKASRPVKILVAGIAGLAGAFLGVGAAIAGVMAAGGFLAPAFGVMLGAILPVTLAIAGLIAIGAALYYAWSNNFLGIRDIVGGALAFIGEWVGKLSDYFGALSDTGRVANDMLSAFPAPLQNILIVVGSVVDGISDFIEKLQGGQGLGAAIDALTDRFKKGFFMDALRGIPSDLLSIFTSIDFGAIGSALWNGLVSALSALTGFAGTVLGYLGDLTAALAGWLWDKASAVDWGGVLSSAAATAGDITGTIVEKLGNLTMAIASWAWEKASAVDWGGILSSAAATAGDITGVIVSKLGNLTVSLASWLWGQAASVNWGGILSMAAGSAGDITGDIVGKLGDLKVSIEAWLTAGADLVDWSGILSTAAAKVGSITDDLIANIGDWGADLKTWYDTGIDSVDWNNLGVTVGEKVGDVSGALVSKAGELIQGFLTHVVDAGLWLGIGKALLTMILALPVTIGYIGITMAPKAAEFLGGFLTGLGLSWPSISGWFVALPGMLLGAVPELLSTLLHKGEDVLTGLKSGFESKWPEVSTWLSELGLKALAAVPDLAASLLTKGQELIGGFKTAAEGKWPEVTEWLGQLGQQALEAIPVLTEQLLQRGEQLITGLLDAAVDKWPEVTDWLATLGDLATEAVGDLLGYLVGRGEEAIQGMINGASTRWVTLERNFKNIPAGLKSAVGELGGLLVSAGTAAIQGLIDGSAARWVTLRDNFAAIPGALLDLVDDMYGIMSGAGANAIQGLIDGANGKLETLRGIVQAAIDIFNAIPGLGNSPWPMMIYAGRDAMDGLVIGLEDRMADLERGIGRAIGAFAVGPDLRAAVNATVSTATLGQPTGGAPVVYNDYRTFTVKVDDLPELVRASEFMNDLQRDRELVYGAI